MLEYQSLKIMKMKRIFYIEKSKNFLKCYRSADFLMTPSAEDNGEASERRDRYACPTLLYNWVFCVCVNNDFTLSIGEMAIHIGIWLKYRLSQAMTPSAVGKFEVKVKQAKQNHYHLLNVDRGRAKAGLHQSLIDRIDVSGDMAVK